jgi:hypothetical protein
MSSFMAIVLVDVNIIAIYELWKSSEFVYLYQITQLCEQKYRLAIPFAEHNFGPLGPQAAQSQNEWSGVAGF